MKVSDTLYAAADYIREHGFSVDYNPRRDCGCFVHAINAICDSTFASSERPLMAVREVIGCAFWSESLRESGWTDERDAIAALEIAADIACAEGN